MTKEARLMSNGVGLVLKGRGFLSKEAGLMSKIVILELRSSRT